MNSDFKDLLVILDHEGVEYLVVGCYAVIHYAQPRYTKNLDIWVQPAPDNAVRLMRAFAAFGLSTFGLVREDFECEGTQLNVGVAPVAIDFLTSLPGVEFSEAWGRREEAECDGIRVNYLSKSDLVAAKRRAGRPTDLADLAELGAADVEEQ